MDSFSCVLCPCYLTLYNPPCSWHVRRSLTMPGKLNHVITLPWLLFSFNATINALVHSLSRIYLLGFSLYSIQHWVRTIHFSFFRHLFLNFFLKQKLRVRMRTKVQKQAAHLFWHSIGWMKPDYIRVRPLSQSKHLRLYILLFCRTLGYCTHCSGQEAITPVSQGEQVKFHCLLADGRPVYLSWQSHLQSLRWNCIFTMLPRCMLDNVPRKHSARPMADAWVLLHRRQTNYFQGFFYFL